MSSSSYQEKLVQGVMDFSEDPIGQTPQGSPIYPADEPYESRVSRLAGTATRATIVRKSKFFAIPMVNPVDQEVRATARKSDKYWKVNSKPK